MINISMRLKEHYTYTFDTKAGLSIFDRGELVVKQPFDSDDGKPFSDVTDALAWAIVHFGDYFTP